jgi:hypothetical protein
MDTVVALLRPLAGCAAMALLCAWMMRPRHTASPPNQTSPPTADVEATSAGDRP